MTENTPASETCVLKTPPLLLGAALVFWGWQSDLLPAGVVMGVILESARFVRARWDLSDDDFRRILTFCTLLTFAAVVYAFTSNEQGGGLGGLFHGPAAARNAGIATVRTYTAFFRWQPMILFLFVAAQIFSTREKIPLFKISRWLSRQKRAGNAPAGNMNVSYPYFILCLFSASFHAGNGGLSFFLGQSALVVWALWRFRPRRSGIVAWALAAAAVVGLGFFSQRGINALQQFAESHDVQWLSRFARQRADPLQNTTAIGRIGELELSDRIVIRLQTENGGSPPAYLREASYRIYHFQNESWFAGGPRSDFDSISPETNQTTWVLLQKSGTASVNIACYLDDWSQGLSVPEGLLPLPSGSSQLENLPAVMLEINKHGAVLAAGPGLVIFDAHYGPGATIDSAPDITRTETNLDFLVPSNEIPALDSVISEMKISGTNEEQKLLAVQNFFSGKFTYSVWQGKDKLATTNETPLARFLLTSRSGHCEYFATATVLLLRELGIPARYAVGYYVHEKSGGGYVVRERDAHAWCLVWDTQTQTWKDFDTTPGSWVGIEGKRAPAMQWLSDFGSWIGFQIAKFRWGQSNLREYIFWGLIPVLALLLYQIIFRRGRRRQTPPETGKSADAISWPGLDSEFYQLERKLATLGSTRQPGEPLSGWLARAVADPRLAAVKNSLEILLRLHYRHRFDPQGLNATDRETLKRESKICLTRLTETI
jgi:hypothetical protein